MAQNSPNKEDVNKKMNEFSNLNAQEQVSTWNSLVALSDADKNEIWKKISVEKKREILKNLIKTKLDDKSFNYFNDFLGLGKDIQKDVLKNNMQELLPLFRESKEVFNQEELLTKFPEELGEGFANLYKNADDKTKQDIAKLFLGEVVKEDGIDKKKAFLSDKMKELFLSKLTSSQKSELATKIGKEAFSKFKDFPDGKIPKLESITLDKSNYIWKGNKLGIDDGKGNLKSWIDFDDIPPWATKIIYKEGILEFGFYTGEKISFNEGSLITTYNNVLGVRKDGSILGGSKRSMNLLQGSVSGSDEIRLDIRYDEKGFAKISLSGNAEQTAIVGKDSFGKDFWISRFRQDSAGKDGKIVEDKQNAEVLIAPNDDMAVKNGIINGIFGKKITGKDYFTKIGNDGLFAGYSYSGKNIEAGFAQAGMMIGSAIGEGSKMIAGLLGSKNKPTSQKGPVDWIPSLEESASSASLPPPVIKSKNNLGLSAYDSKQIEGFFDVSYEEEIKINTRQETVGTGKDAKTVTVISAISTGGSGLKIVDEGTGYGVVDVTNTQLPIKEVRIRSDSVIQNENMPTDAALNLRYLVDGGSLLRFGKEDTYIERAVSQASVPIPSIINENLKTKEGKDFSLVLSSFGDSGYNLYLAQDTAGLKPDQRVSNKVTVTMDLSYGSKKGYNPVTDSLLSLEITTPAGEKIPTEVLMKNIFDASSSSDFAMQEAAKQLAQHPFVSRRIERRPNGFIASKVNEKIAEGIGQAYQESMSGVQQGLNENDPAKTIFGEAYNTVTSKIGDTEAMMGGWDSNSAYNQWADNVERNVKSVIDSGTINTGRDYDAQLVNFYNNYKNGQITRQQFTDGVYGLSANYQQSLGAEAVKGTVIETVVNSAGKYWADKSTAQISGRQTLVGYAQQALDNQLTYSIDSWVPIIGGDYRADTSNMGGNAKDALNFYRNYDSEMKKFQDFMQKATLAPVGNSYIRINTIAGTIESNGETLNSPFLARQLAINLASSSGLTRFNIVRKDVGGEYQKTNDAISRTRVIYSGDSGTSQTISTLTYIPSLNPGYSVPGAGCDTGGCSSGRCGDGKCN